MLPEQIAFMFSVINPPADLTVKSRIEMFFKKDLHLKMEKADTDKDWSFLNKLADKGYMDAMKYHRKGVGDVIKLPYFDKWLIQYESAMNAFDMAQLRDEKYELYLKWSDTNDELKDAKSHASALGAARLRAETECKKLKEENEILKKSNETYEDLLAGNKGLIDENKKLKEELEIYKKREAECNDKMTELAEYKKNMRAVLNMIEYTIGGGSDVSMKIHEILWNGADTTFE